MMQQVNRRQFVAGTCAAGATALLGGGLLAAPEQAPFKTTLKKSMITGKITADGLKKYKDAGFDGMECGAIVSPDEAKAAREVAEKVGIRIHSVLRGWAEFNSTDEKKAQGSWDVCANALRAAAGYGASAVLIVPCRIGGTKQAPMEMPKPWDFDIEFDGKTGHVVRVVKGDNAPFKAYIDAHNRAIDTSTLYVKKLIPVAEETKVVIALENVWNNLWVKPAIFAHFVGSFAHPLVKAYFDIGNHVKYAPPQEWIKALGGLIAKCHVKDFKLNADGHDGKFVHPRDGSVDWPAVRKALDEVGYSDFMTIEDGGLSLEEFSKRLDLIVTGK